MTSRPRLLLLHLIGNALLLWFGYLWLGMAESSIPRLVWSAFLAFVLIAGALWLHGSAMSSMRAAARNLLPLLVLGLVTLIIYGLVAYWKEVTGPKAIELASWLTLKVRKPVKPDRVIAAFNAVFWVFRWLVLPVLLLPLYARVANAGWRGFGDGWWQRPRRHLHWIVVPLLLWASIWLPLKLLAWIPQMSSFALEMTSFVLRLAIAYLLFVAGFLTLEFFTSSGNPPRSQPSTAGSP